MMIELTADQIREAIRLYADRRYGKTKAVTLSNEVSAVVSTTDEAPKIIECPYCKGNSPEEGNRCRDPVCPQCHGELVVPVDYNPIPTDAAKAADNIEILQRMASVARELEWKMRQHFEAKFVRIDNR